MTTPTLALSFAAGILSFLSPCVVPLIPSYLSYIGGVAVTELREGEVRRLSVVIRTLFFVLGFTVVFVALGVLFSGSGMLFGAGGRVINIIAGIIVVVLGLNIIFDFWKFLNVERKMQFAERPAGHVGAALIGMAFGAVWTPCIGPILASILLLAGTSGNVGTGVALLVAFSLGLGLPFIIASVFFTRVVESLKKIKRHLGTIKIAGGILLIGIGVLIALGRFSQLAQWFITTGARLRAFDAANPHLSRRLVAGVVLLLGLLPIAVAGIRRLAGSQTARPMTPAKAIWLALTGIPALLSLLGVINLAHVFAGWFQYTGL